MLNSNAINLTAIYIDDTSNSTQPFKPRILFLSFFLHLENGNNKSKHIVAVFYIS